MRRATLFIIFCASAGLLIALTGCNLHPTKEVEYVHWTGEAVESGDESGTGTSATDGDETGTGSSTTSDGDESGDDGSDTGIKFDVGPECGNGIVEPGEECDEGEDNGPSGSCTDDCLWNIQ